VIRAVAVLLLLYEPLNFAAEALGVLPTMAYRGWVASLELSAHAAVAALAAAGGLALLNGTPAAHRLAAAGVVASWLRTIQALSLSALPHNTVPGHEPMMAGVVTAVAGASLIVIRSAARRSRS
jgi:hypothetical protein